MCRRSIRVYIHMIMVFLIITGALSMSIYGVQHDDISILAKIILIIMGASAVYLALDRNTYLPFLGDTVIPPSLLNDVATHPNANLEIEIEVDEKNAVSVIYWAADELTAGEKDGQKYVRDAYGVFDNSGVAKITNKIAILNIACPQEYWVRKFGIKMTLPKHVHYRVVYSDGWVSEVKTVYVKC